MRTIELRGVTILFGIFLKTNIKSSHDLGLPIATIIQKKGQEIDIVLTNRTILHHWDGSS